MTTNRWIPGAALACVLVAAFVHCAKDTSTVDRAASTTPEAGAAANGNSASQKTPASAASGDADDAPGAAGAAEKGEASDEVVTMAQVSDAAKTALKPYASDREVKKIEKGDDDGTLAFEFDIVHAGKKLEVSITPAGKVLGTEETVVLSAVPDPVQATIKAQSAGGTIVSVEKVIEAGKTTYEAVIGKNGRHAEITVGPDGRLLPGEGGKEGGF